MLEIKNVTKSFDRPLFKEMSMTFQETGMYVIVGKSGSGKSTLLNIFLKPLDNLIHLDYINKVLENFR